MKYGQKKPEDGLKLQHQRQIWEKYLTKSKLQIDLEALCFPKQLAFIQDKSRFVTAVTSRRAGKTTACSLHLLYTALNNPNSVSFYITYSRVDAKGIVWPLLHKLNRDLNLGGEANEADLTWKFKNGSMIRLGGAATPVEINRFRGYAIKLAYIDESQRFGSYLQQLVDDVLVPGTIDHRGQIRLIGTPGSVPFGYFYDSYRSEKVSTHSWDIFSNPWIEDPQGVLNEELVRKGITIDDPTIQREFFGKWVIDRAKLVIEYDSTKNHFDTLPNQKFYYIMGIDLGYQDADAVCILAHSNSGPTTYLVDELITTKQGLTELFHQVEVLRKIYDPYKIVIDTGGLGLKIAEELRRRYRLPVRAAEKTRKFENIELFNDALRTERFRARRDSRFASDSYLLEWDTEKLKPDKKIVSAKFHSDIIDAVLYAFRESPAYTYEAPKRTPKVGSPEWGKEEEVRMEEGTIERLKSEQNLLEEGLEWL